MAYNGKYPVKLKEPQKPYNWGEILRCGYVAEHECWGGETQMPNGRDWLISHSPYCDGKIHPGELYLKRKDRRDATVYWRISIWCAVRFHEERLDGELAAYHGYTDEEIETFKAQLIEAEKVLTELPDIGTLDSYGFSEEGSHRRSKGRDRANSRWI